MFDSSIERVVGQPSPGDQVDVNTHEGQFIARGLYNPTSTIRVRLYRWDPARSMMNSGRGRSRRRPICGARSWLGTGKSACRLIFSEGDGLSGLTVDRYDRWLAARFSSLALYSRRDLSSGCLPKRPVARESSCGPNAESPKRRAYVPAS